MAIGDTQVGRVPGPNAARSLVLALLVALVVGAPSWGGEPETGGEPRPAAVSLLGRPLIAPKPPEAFRIAQEAQLAAAVASLAAHPDDPDARIWVGRRTAYLGRYDEAIEIFGVGAQRHPQDPRFLRHRGHRNLTLRRLAAAVSDLERAAALAAGRPDRVEPDGLPNWRNTPTSTLKSNIYYHLGLAHYLRHDLARARDAWQSCLAVSDNPDMLVATTYWLWLTLRRQGDEEGATRALAPIRSDLTLVENGDYHRLLLAFRGEVGAEDLLLEARDAGGVSAATVGYGVGAWHLLGGRRAEAEAIFRQVVEGDAWSAFGHLAAESELARWQAEGGPQPKSER